MGDAGQRDLDRSPGTQLTLKSDITLLWGGVSGMPVEAKLVIV